jgi:putative ABC transport system permease protein
MSDWKSYVRERLNLRRLRPERQAEIVEDLAQQLDEAYRTALAGGAGIPEAEAAARGEIQDWDRLALDILLAETRDRLSFDQRALESLEARGSAPAGAPEASARDGSPRSAAALLRQFSSELAADVLHGLRLLKQRPGFTAAVVVTLALGVGANSAMFTILNAVLLRPLPYPEPDRLAVVWDSLPSRGWTEFAVSGPNFLDYREQGGAAFERLAAAVHWPANLTAGGEAERIPGRAVSHDFFPLFGVRPILGRVFLPEEDKPGGDRVVLISRGLWQRRFGADPGTVGRAITLNDIPRTVIGILPEFYWGRADVFVPLRADPNEQRDNHLFSVFGRLRPGVTIEQARGTLAGVARRLARQYPASNAGWTVTINPYFDWIVPQESRRALYMLLGAVGLVLLIACANVAGLLLARASGRRREIAIRAAIGASRARLIRQLLAEAMLLATLGGGLGLLCAQWGVSALSGAAATALPRGAEISLDTRVLLFTLGVCLLTGLLFGLAPALQATRVDFHATLKEGAGGGVARQRARSVLVITEIALSLVLLVGVGLLLRSLTALLDVPSGFEPRKLLTASLNLPGSRYPKAKDYTAFHGRLLEQLRTAPGIESASIASGLPMDGNATMMEVHPEGLPAPTDGPAPSAQWRLVSPGYFRTMGIPLRAGRDVVDTDVAPDTGDFRGAVISETLARQCWPGQDPIGRRFHPWSTSNPPVTVVGLVGDVKLFSLDERPTPAVYLTYLTAWNPIQVVVRTQGDPTAAAGLLRREVAAIDPGISVAELHTMGDLIDRTTSSRRFTMTLLAIFAGGAVFLAGVGLFGLLAFLVAQWTHDIGIRLALGARGPDILRLVVGRAMLLTSVGIGAGIVVSLALAGSIRSLLFGVGARDPVTLAATVLLLLLMALLACWIPARRAMRIDPVVALRYE